MLYSSFEFVRKFKFCVSPLVKRYPDSLNFNIYICLTCCWTWFLQQFILDAHKLTNPKHYGQTKVIWDIYQKYQP